MSDEQRTYQYRCFDINYANGGEGAPSEVVVSIDADEHDAAVADGDDDADDMIDDALSDALRDMGHDCVPYPFSYERIETED